MRGQFLSLSVSGVFQYSGEILNPLAAQVLQMRASRESSPVGIPRFGCAGKYPRHDKIGPNKTTHQNLVMRSCCARPASSPVVILNAHLTSRCDILMDRELSPRAHGHGSTLRTALRPELINQDSGTSCCPGPFGAVLSLNGLAAHGRPSSTTKYRC
jgi:hypothetical protein